MRLWKFVDITLSPNNFFFLSANCFLTFSIKLFDGWFVTSCIMFVLVSSSVLPVANENCTNSQILITEVQIVSSLFICLPFFTCFPFFMRFRFLRASIFILALRAFIFLRVLRALLF